MNKIKFREWDEILYFPRRAVLLKEICVRRYSASSMTALDVARTPRWSAGAGYEFQVGPIRASLPALFSLPVNNGLSTQTYAKVADR